MMVSHVGPRAGCGCCMPCEVVACIVVLPLPVGSLLGISCLLLVGIYLHDLPQIFGFVCIFAFQGFVLAFRRFSVHEASCHCNSTKGMGFSCCCFPLDVLFGGVSGCVNTCMGMAVSLSVAPRWVLLALRGLACAPLCGPWLLPVIRWKCTSLRCPLATRLLNMSPLPRMAKVTSVPTSCDLRWLLCLSVVMLRVIKCLPP